MQNRVKSRGMSFPEFSGISEDGFHRCQRAALAENHKFTWLSIKSVFFQP